MNEIMPKPNKTLWMILALIPGCGSLLVLGGWFAIYRSLAIINPQTSRTIGKDILLTLVTCGLFGLALPYLIIKDTQEGCKTLGIDAPDYTAHVYGLIFLNIVVNIGITLSGNPDLVMLTYVTGGVFTAAMMHFYLDPFVKIAEAYNE